MKQAVESVDPEVGGVHSELKPNVSLTTAKWGRTLSDVQTAEAAAALKEEQDRLAWLQDVKERTEGTPPCKLAQVIVGIP